MMDLDYPVSSWQMHTATSSTEESENFNVRQNCSSENNRISCFRCGAEKESEEELKAHVSWDHLQYSPYRCSICSLVCRPTEKMLMDHIAESHPDTTRPEMVYAPLADKQRTLEFEICQSQRLQRERLETANEKILTATPSSESACSGSFASDGNETPPRSSKILDIPFCSSSGTPQCLALSLENSCQLCSGDVKPQMHDHVIKQDGNLQYGMIYAKCFPSPVFLPKIETTSVSSQEFLPIVEIKLALRTLKVRFHDVKLRNRRNSKMRLKMQHKWRHKKNTFRGSRKLTINLINQQYVVCYVCQETVEASKVFQHVLNNHLEEHCVRCLRCGFKSRYNYKKVQEHSKEVHAGQAEMIEDRKAEFAHRLKELLRSCFPSETCLKEGSTVAIAPPKRFNRGFNGSGPKSWKAKKLARKKVKAESISEAASRRKSSQTNVLVSDLFLPLISSESAVHGVSTLSLCIPGKNVEMAELKTISKENVAQTTNQSDLKLSQSEKNVSRKTRRSDSKVSENATNEPIIDFSKSIDNRSDKRHLISVKSAPLPIRIRRKLTRSASDRVESVSTPKTRLPCGGNVINKKIGRGSFGGNCSGQSESGEKVGIEIGQDGSTVTAAQHGLGPFRDTGKIATIPRTAFTSSYKRGLWTFQL